MAVSERLPLIEYLRQKHPVPKQMDMRTVQERSVMAVQYYVRSTKYLLNEQLLSIGSRPLKHFFVLKGNSKSYMLASTLKEQRSKVNAMTLKCYSRILKQLKHPNIAPAHEVDFLPDSNLSLVVRPFYSKGSLRDLIYKAKPRNLFSIKYNQKVAKPLKPAEIATYGKQILNGLFYLERQGIPYTHLHTGNIFVKKGVCYITETENAFLKLERFYEYIFRDFSSNNNEAFVLADLNVLAFGAVIYEMAVGYPMGSLQDINRLDSIPYLDVSVKDILWRIFTPERLVPSVSDLLFEPFFSNAFAPDAIINTIEWSVQEKEFIKSAVKTNSTIIWPTDEAMLMQTLSFKGSTPKNRKKRSTLQKGSRNSIQRSQKSTLDSSVPSSPSMSKPTQPSNPPPPPPPGGPPPPPNFSSSSMPPPPPPGGPPPPTSSAPGRSSLLSSISSFNAKQLKKTVTIDKSKPIL